MHRRLLRAAAVAAIVYGAFAMAGIALTHWKEAKGTASVIGALGLGACALYLAIIGVIWMPLSWWRELRRPRC
jgi:hypothetical protein